jgi:hypothetical protein
VSRLRSPFQPILADRLKRNRSLLRSQIESLFAPELTLMERREAGVAVAAADVLTSFESHQLLLRDQELSAGQAKEAMSSALVALLGTGR